MGGISGIESKSMKTPGQGSPLRVAGSSSITGRVLFAFVIVAVICIRVFDHPTSGATIYGGLETSAPAYVASTEIRTLARESNMTADGERLFLSGRPKLMAADEFDKACAVHKDDFITGCEYAGSPPSVYLFRVTEPSLAGLAQVTAAHEMLHVVWDSMTEQARGDFRPLLDDEYARYKATLGPRLATYGKLSRADWYSELHSIVGTEVARVDPTLAAHYSSYLRDRAELVEAGNKADAVLAAADDREYRLLKRLNSMKNIYSSEYNKLYAQYLAARDAYSRLRFLANEPVDD